MTKISGYNHNANTYGAPTRGRQRVGKSTQEAPNVSRSSHGALSSGQHKVEPGDDAAPSGSDIGGRSHAEARRRVARSLPEDSPPTPTNPDTDTDTPTVEPVFVSKKVGGITFHHVPGNTFWNPPRVPSQRPNPAPVPAPAAPQEPPAASPPPPPAAAGNGSEHDEEEDTDTGQFNPRALNQNHYYNSSTQQVMANSTLPTNPQTGKPIQPGEAIKTPWGITMLSSDGKTLSYY